MYENKSTSAIQNGIPFPGYYTKPATVVKYSGIIVAVTFSAILANM